MCEVEFRDSGAKPNRPDQTGSEFAAGGLGIRGPIIAANEASWLAMQPNHAQTVSWQAFPTALGLARVYTLDRDRAPNGQPGGGTWRAQQAYLPVGARSYELWLQVSASAPAAVDPQLAHMLQSLRPVTP